MRHYNGATDKPHFAYSNSPYIRQLDKGRLQRAQQQDSTKNVIKTCVKYKDSHGRTRYKGTSELKGTELLATGS